jgi:hypothetical protein
MNKNITHNDKATKGINATGGSQSLPFNLVAFFFWWPFYFK